MSGKKYDLRARRTKGFIRKTLKEMICEMDFENRREADLQGDRGVEIDLRRYISIEKIIPYTILK